MKFLPALLKNRHTYRLQEWMDRGRSYKIKGHQIFTIHRPIEDKPYIVFLHGFPTCSYDFNQVLTLLGSDVGYTVHDHLGFGLSSKPEKHNYSLIEQAKIALELWQHLDIRSAHVVAHDYGTGVATELLAQKQDGFEPVELRSMVLSNGSILIDQAHLRQIQKLLRNRWTGPITAYLANFHTFRRNLNQLTSQRISDLDMSVLWSLLISKNGKMRIPAISKYLDERQIFRARWVGAFKDTSVPITLLWGEKDPIAHRQMVFSLQKERTSCDIHWLPCGHYPMLEVAGQYTQIINRLVF